MAKIDFSTEKEIVLTGAELKAIIETAKEEGVDIVLNYLYPLDSDFESKELKEFLKDKMKGGDTMSDQTPEEAKKERELETEKANNPVPEPTVAEQESDEEKEPKSNGEASAEEISADATEEEEEVEEEKQ